jgi:hypothetical protein
MKYFIALLLLLAPSSLFAATIYTTASSDTLNTFRTNVNSSLTNLNTSLSTTTATLGLGLSYSTTLGYLVGGTSGTLTIATSTLYTGATNSLAYFSGTNTLGQIAAGTNGYYLGMTSGVPTWTATSTLFTNSGSGLNILQTSPTLITPTLGVAVGTSLALGGATLGSNAIAITGTGFLSSNLGVGSTSPAFRLSVNDTASDFYITSAGKVIAYDTANNWQGRVSPTHSLVLGTATTTTWIASTTSSGFSPIAVMPFAGTLRQARCTTYVGASAGSFIGVNVKVAGSDATPSYFVSSSTVGVEKFTAGNTFTAGQQILANFGTTTTATATSVSCTLDITETI